MSAVDVLSGPAIEVRDALKTFTLLLPSMPRHVLHGRASFEEVPPIDDMRSRMNKVAKDGLPWLVALYHGIVVGYSYASFYRPREAYRYTLEESIYVDASMIGRGIGSTLMGALIARCEAGPWRQMIAVIGDGNNNTGSLRLHKSTGLSWPGNCAASAIKRGLAGYVDYAAPTQRR